MQFSIVCAALAWSFGIAETTGLELNHRDSMAE
jgi:hypothetical protein